VFELYVEHRWFPRECYAALIGVLAALRPSRVLEFGPGTSTRAFIEAGVDRVDTCEDDPMYYKRAVVDLAAFPRVTVHKYSLLLGVPLSVPAVDGERFDFGHVDGPFGPESRPPTIRYALERCGAVLCHDARETHVLPYLRTLEAEGFRVELIETPNMYALVTRP
jgi:hypothetical protein